MQSANHPGGVPWKSVLEIWGFTWVRAWKIRNYCRRETVFVHILLFLYFSIFSFSFSFFFELSHTAHFLSSLAFYSFLSFSHHLPFSFIRLSLSFSLIFLPFLFLSPHLYILLYRYFIFHVLTHPHAYFLPFLYYSISLVHFPSPSLSLFQS